MFYALHDLSSGKLSKNTLTDFYFNQVFTWATVYCFTKGLQKKDE